MLNNFINCIMLIIVMIMSRDIVSYVIRMFYLLCEIVITIEASKFMYSSYIDIIISV